MNQEDIQRKISGEYIALKEENSYLCNFDEGFNLGIIHIVIQLTRMNMF